MAFVGIIMNYDLESKLSGNALQVTTYRIYNVASCDPRNPLRTAASGVDAESASGWGPEADGAVDEVGLLQHTTHKPKKCLHFWWCIGGGKLRLTALPRGVLPELLVLLVS